MEGHACLLPRPVAGPMCTGESHVGNGCLLDMGNESSSHALVLQSSKTMSWPALLSPCLPVGLKELMCIGHLLCYLS